LRQGVPHSMAVPSPALVFGSPTGRVRATAELMERRGYAVSAPRLGQLCLGGPLPEPAVREAALRAGLLESQGIVVTPDQRERARGIAARAGRHDEAAAVYLPETLRFVGRLLELAPFVISIAIAGSLASGGFTVTDDVDLNLVVEDGYRHQAYVVLNVLGMTHALRHRRKPVDDLTRRPLAPRLMTANLVLERSDWFPLVRQDADMAFELLVQQPVFGEDGQCGRFVLRKIRLQSGDDSGEDFCRPLLIAGIDRDAVSELDGIFILESELRRAGGETGDVGEPQFERAHAALLLAQFHRQEQTCDAFALFAVDANGRAGGVNGALAEWFFRHFSRLGDAPRGRRAGAAGPIGGGLPLLVSRLPFR